MFTGLIEHVGKVVQTLPCGAGRRLVIDAGQLADSLEVGGSLAVDGACLTVTRTDGNQLSFDVSEHTCKTTTLGQFERGRVVNLERPLTLKKGLGGHLVAGHVDGVGSLRRWKTHSQGKVGEFEANSQIMHYIIAKGSVSVNGVSLTIAELSKDSFSVVLIPQTLASTNLGELRVADKVNLETDLIGKYVAKFLGGRPSGKLSMEVLRDNGFV